MFNIVRIVGVDTGTAAQALRFDHPPVRSVSLTVYFEAVQGMLITSTGSIVEAIKSDFPIVVERFAELPWVLEDDEDADFEVPDLPFPYLSFDNGSGHSVHFQDDRFRIQWAFTDGHGYPGFNVLREQLSEHFTLFEKQVQVLTGQSPRISHVQVRYDNPVDAPVTLDVMLRAHGIDTMSGTPLVLSNPITDAVFHGTIEFPSDRVKADVAIFASDGAGSASGRLRLLSRARLPKPLVGEWRDLLDQAHENLIVSFGRLTSAEQKTRWGIIP
jgi:uncharacterized protein (TIGR04255 family)